MSWLSPVWDLTDCKFEIIPVGEPDTLANSTFYQDLFKEQPKLKLQHEFLELVCLRAQRQFYESLDHTDTSEKIALLSLRIPGHSVLSRLFTANLCQQDVRLTKSEFTIAARQFIFLPPLKNRSGTVVESKCGCERQLCANVSCAKRDSPLDSSGNHALVCHPGVKSARATILEKSLDKLYRKAGGVPRRQPSTYSLLGGHFTKEDLVRLFPGRLDKEQTAARLKLAMRYLDILPMSRRHERIAALGEWRDSLPPAARVDEKDESGGVIRFDLALPASTPLACPRELVFDHAIVQETSPTYADDVLKYLQANTNSDTVGSVAFKKVVQSKRRRFASLMPVVNRLLEERKLGSQPTFLFPVISSLGFMNDDMQTVLKFTVDRFKEYQRHLPARLDGIEPKIILGRFKVELKNSICFALLKGNALAMNNQGVRGVVCPS